MSFTVRGPFRVLQQKTVMHINVSYQVLFVSNNKKTILEGEKIVSVLVYNHLFRLDHTSVSLHTHR